MKFKILITLLMFAVTGCATINLQVKSRINPDYSYNKTENIFVKIRSTPTEEKQKLVELLEIALIDNGFIIVDSLYKADRIIELNLSNSSYFHQSSSTSNSNSFREIQGLFEKPYFDLFDEKYSNSYPSTKKGYSSLYIIMYDTSTTKPRYQSTVWYSSVLAPTEKIHNYPEIAIKLILKQYGIEEAYSSTYPKK